MRSLPALLLLTCLGPASALEVLLVDKALRDPVAFHSFFEDFPEEELELAYRRFHPSLVQADRESFDVIIVAGGTHPDPAPTASRPRGGRPPRALRTRRRHGVFSTPGTRRTTSSSSPSSTPSASRCASRAGGSRTPSGPRRPSSPPPTTSICPGCRSRRGLPRRRHRGLHRRRPAGLAHGGAGRRASRSRPDRPLLHAAPRCGRHPPAGPRGDLRGRTPVVRRRGRRRLRRGPRDPGAPLDDQPQRLHRPRLGPARAPALLPRGQPALREEPWPATSAPSPGAGTSRRLVPMHRVDHLGGESGLPLRSSSSGDAPSTRRLARGTTTTSRPSTRRDPISPPSWGGGRSAAPTSPFPPGSGPRRYAAE